MKWEEGLLSFGENAFIQPIWQWEFWGCNWYTFDFIHLQFENDSMMGAYEAQIVLLGVGFRWRWTHKETEASRELARRVKDIQDGEKTVER